MTTELEQEFFKVFEIEPIEYRKNVPCLNFLSSGICNITDERCNPGKCNEYRPDKTSRLWRDFMEVYPEITAEKLLELVYIIGVKPYGFLYLNDTYSTNINSKTDIILVEADDFREGVLTLAIQPRVALRIKKQVRALFKGEE